jgi:hypothetical protein
MSRRSKRDYLLTIHPRYRRAGLREKGKILDEFCKVCGYNRKYAIRVLNGSPPPKKPPPRCFRPRGETYPASVIRVLRAVWEAANYPWSTRLKALLPLWLPWIRQRFGLTRAQEKQLLAISARQIDRRLQEHKTLLKRRLYGRTKPGTLLKHHVPIKTDHWDVTQAGYAEIDLVSHSGERAEGEFIHSLTLTDIHSTWTETRAVMGKGEAGVVAAIDEMRRGLPFPLLGLDSDNGSEFLNYHLVRYTDERKIQFTRSRPYKKDDNAHVEQKNWTHVRRLMGWERYDTNEALEAMNALYRNELRLMMNLFLPSVKLLRKERVGSRLRRFYGPALTPLDRLLEANQGDRRVLAGMKSQRSSIDPFELSGRVSEKLELIWERAHQRQNIKPRKKAA